jgi:hypothetical protein
MRKSAGVVLDVDRRDPGVFEGGYGVVEGFRIGNDGDAHASVMDLACAAS